MDIIFVYAIGIIGAAIILLSWNLYFQKKKSGLKKGDEATKVKVVRALVVNLDTHVLDNEDLSEEKAKEIGERCGSLGRERFETAQNEKVYFLTKKGEEYSPLPKHPDTTITPRFIGWGLSVGLTLPGWFRLDTQQNQSGNLKQILWWTGIIAVIVFLVVVD